MRGKYARALIIAVFVGSLLICINHGDVLLNGNVDLRAIFKIILTPVVPFCVSLFSSTMSERLESQRRAANSSDQVEAREENQTLVSKTVGITSQLKVNPSKLDDVASKLSENDKLIHSATATIKEIAKNTNLLAINATIEASKAGEHGVGFVVIAEEIHKIADKTKEASKVLDNFIIQNQSAIEET